jgi:hypothetical protein
MNKLTLFIDRVKIPAVVSLNSTFKLIFFSSKTAARMNTLFHDLALAGGNIIASNLKYNLVIS